ncbi:hypothetical protein K1719_040927 [Acacia pycnantha]|nr:hypothetical protein K1719_040927 [Acacia pycnantha]
MEIVGFPGGIWIVWDRDDLKVEVLVKEDQFVHCKIGSGTEVLLLTAVYANPAEQRRIGLWDALFRLAENIREPWLVAGDFNEIKSPLEQKGGGRVNDLRCRRFSDWIQSCGLHDVEAKWPFFTWKRPKWEGLDRVHKRLDRC